MATGRHRSHLNLVVVTCMLPACYVQVTHAGKICGPYYWGKSFYFAIPGLYRASSQNLPVSYNISVTISAKENGSVTVLAKGQKIREKYDIIEGTTLIDVPETVVQPYGQPSIQNKGIRLTSTTKISLRLVVVGKYRSGGDWYTFERQLDLLPTGTLSTEYTIPYNGMMGIHIVGLKKTVFTIAYEENGKRQTVERSLQKFDSFLLNGTFRSGINLISGKARLAVFCHANLADYNYTASTVQQIPTATTGNKFIIPLGSNSLHFRAVALNNGTVVEATSDSHSYIMALDKGEYIQSRPKSHAIGLSSNKPILVIRYYSKWIYNDVNRPTVAPVVAFSQYCNGYLFETDSDSDLTVVVSSDYENEFVFHEKDIPWWRQVSYISMNGTQYFVAKTEIAKSESFRQMSLRNPNSTFGGYLDDYPLGIHVCG